jgi:hypothetical protein
MRQMIAAACAAPCQELRRIWNVGLARYEDRSPVEVYATTMFTFEAAVPPDAAAEEFARSLERARALNDLEPKLGGVIEIGVVISKTRIALFGVRLIRESDWRAKPILR